MGLSMKTSPVSYVNYNKNLTRPNQKRPSFGDIWFAKLQPQEIKELYEDGPRIWQIIEETTPILLQKLGKNFDAGFEVFPDVLRTINIRINATTGKLDEIKNHIIKNNDKTFKFPKDIIDEFKAKSDNYLADKWLRTMEHTPFSIKYDKIGPYRTRAQIVEFAEKYNEDETIKALYKANPPNLHPREHIPENRWLFPGG